MEPQLREELNGTDGDEYDGRSFILVCVERGGGEEKREWEGEGKIEEWTEEGRQREREGGRERRRRSEGKTG